MDGCQNVNAIRPCASTAASSSSRHACQSRRRTRRVCVCVLCWLYTDGKFSVSREECMASKSPKKQARPTKILRRDEAALRVKSSVTHGSLAWKILILSCSFSFFSFFCRAYKYLSPSISLATNKEPNSASGAYIAISIVTLVSTIEAADAYFVAAAAYALGYVDGVLGQRLSEKRVRTKAHPYSGYILFCLLLRVKCRSKRRSADSRV